MLIWRTKFEASGIVLRLGLLGRDGALVDYSTLISPTLRMRSERDLDGAVVTRAVDEITGDAEYNAQVAFTDWSDLAAGTYRAEVHAQDATGRDVVFPQIDYLRIEFDPQT